MALTLSPEDIKAILDAMKAPAAPEVQSDWLNGHSRITSRFGSVRVKIVDDWIATLPKHHQDKVPCFFYYGLAWQDGGFVSKEAELTCRHNLSCRNWIVWGQRMFEAVPVRFEIKEVKGADIPWDEKMRYTIIPTHGEFIPNSISWGWDDTTIGPDQILDFCKEFYERLLASGLK